ncbi:MAG: MlaD family protein [Desulfobulbaceae bacterium]
MNDPIVRKGRGISPIWILPLVALCITGWLLYTSYLEAGIPVTIHFNDAEGITAGKTRVMYRGVPVGLVERITVDEDLKGVNVHVTMEKKSRRGLVEDTRFWIVKPEISAGRISGLETILSGSYIAMQPGGSERFAASFEGQAETPPPPPDSPGLHITLVSDALYSLQKDSPVYMKNLKIGRVLRYYLGDDRSVLIDLYIEPEYSHLIQMGTRFWNSSGVAFEGNLRSGFSLKFQSLAALVYGGISCGTPDPLVETSPRATNGLVFKLYPDYEAAEYWLPMTLKISSGEGIIEGRTKVMYRGLEAGVVNRIRIENDEDVTITAEILLDPRAEPILKEGTRFWVVRPEFSLGGIDQLNTLISGPYITFIPGEGVYRDRFVAEKGPMPRQITREGRKFVLTAPEKGELDAGAPVLFKGMAVGEVYEVEMEKDGSGIRAEIVVYEEYKHLVRTGSVFWNTSGVRIEAGLTTGIRVDAGTLKSLLQGGVSFANPEPGDGASGAPEAGEGSRFVLYRGRAEAAEAMPGILPPGRIIHLESNPDKYYSTGSPVLYRKIPVGEVIETRPGNKPGKTRIDLLVFRKYEKLVNASSLFFDESGFSLEAGLGGVNLRMGGIATLLNGGIAFVTPEEAPPPPSKHLFTLYDDYEGALHRDDLTITLHLDRACNLAAQAKIVCRGIQIGRIHDLRFGPGMEEVIATARVRREAEVFFRENSVLRLVRPRVDFTGIRNIETILTGSFIEVMPGEGELRTDFPVREGEVADESGGLHLVLETSRLGFLDVGDPVYYRQIQVGRVTGYELSPDARQVFVFITIYSTHRRLVRKGTKFWLAGGVRASWDLFSGLELDAESVESLLAGGIGFATPEGEEMGGPAEDGDHFPLYEEKKEKWSSWAPDLNTAQAESKVDNGGDTL